MMASGDGAPIRATVKWFNTAKGFGFVTPADGSPEAFAAGMSAAMAQASEEIIIDVSGAIRGAGPEESR